MRLVPLVPFNLLNYALGLTGISLRAYVLTSAVCMLPGLSLIPGSVMPAARQPPEMRRRCVMGCSALECSAMIAFLPRLLRRLRARKPGWIDAAELQRRVASGKAPVVIDVRQPEGFTALPGRLPGAINH